MPSKNVGMIDRVARVLFGIFCLYMFSIGTSALSWAWLLGLIPAIAGLFGRCPLYSAFGLSTRSRESV